MNELVLPEPAATPLLASPGMPLPPPYAPLKPDDFTSWVVCALYVTS
ncbi:MAG TPA: hypothetical protein VN224_09935 [Xanthomonadales bacterium]|nr:hypothetical protein [Xanthomonadales bacterium]